MRFIGICLLALGFSCSVSPPDKEKTEVDWENVDSFELNPEIEPSEEIQEDPPTELELSLLEQGLVNVQDLDSTIAADIKYATTDNFMGQVLYDGYNKCYLLPEVAEMLLQAHEVLKTSHPDLRFLIFDGTRPNSVQVQMWEKVKGTEFQNYVASPRAGSMHNYGAAVDLGLTHIDSGLVDMGTEYDYFGEEAQPRFEEKFVHQGILTKDQVENRRILRRSMNKAGFVGILNEWWHFNAFSKQETRERFKRVE